MLWAFGCCVVSEAFLYIPYFWCFRKSWLFDILGLDKVYYTIWAHFSIQWWCWYGYQIQACKTAKIQPIDISMRKIFLSINQLIYKFRI